MVGVIHMPTILLRISKYRQPAIVLLILLAFFLRANDLDRQALRGDEAATVLYAAMPVTELWELSRITDPHPPLYYLLLHPWQAVVGESAWAMRFVGVMAGTLAVAALYRLVRRTLSQNIAAVLAAGLLAVNPLQIWLAQDIRSYPFFTLLGLLSAWALWAALHSRGISTGRWSLYVLLTVASLYTHYYTIFLMAFEGLFVLLNARVFWPKRWSWLISQIVIGVLIIPGLQLAWNFIGQAAGGIDTIPPAVILQRASTALLTGFTIGDNWGLAVSLLMAPVWSIGMISMWRRNRVAGSFWAMFFVLPVVGVIALSLDRPFFKERFLIQAQPAFELLLAAGFIWMVKVNKPIAKFTSIIMLTALLFTNVHALTNYRTDPAYAKAPPWHLYRDYVRGKARPGDVMLTNFPEAAVSYYSPNELPFYVVPAERDHSVKYREEQTAQIANAYQRIWFLPMQRQGFDEEGDVLHWLDRHGDRVDQVFFPAFNVNLYLSPAMITGLMIPQPAVFEHGVRLRGYQILNKRGESRLRFEDVKPVLNLKPVEEFTLSLYWQADAPPPAPYTVFVHLIAADGFNRVSRDNQPVWGSYPTTHWTAGEQITDKYTLTIPEGTPPGDHRLRIGWYQSDTLTPAPTETGEDFITLTAVIQIEGE
jgi:hypothetical protein